MSFRCRKWCKVIVALYMIGSCITSFLFIKLTLNSSIQDGPALIPWEKNVIFLSRTTRSTNIIKNQSVVEIWGKAAIGLYLWQHVFEGPLHLRSPGWNSGEVLVNQILFRFHTGPGVMIDTVSQDVSNVLLVLNGREPSKIDYAREWLDYVTRFPGLNSVGVVLLGNEQCSNDWIRKYMKSAGGTVKYFFVVYDSLEVDENFIFQWPLGVATYRNFPVVASEELDLFSPRKYVCNFVGTVYPNSSREILLDILHSDYFAGRCYVKERLEWQPNETEESLNGYISTLMNSDLTLNPIGMNAECYRIYEAMSYGSVPVIEDRPASAQCGDRSQNSSKVLRLLKKYQAPVLYIDDWKKLPELLEREKEMTIEQIVKRRQKIVEWYSWFCHQMRDRLVDVVSNNL